jgi:hypothetical protein
VLVFETDALLTPWLCYRARHNDVYFDKRAIGEGPVPSFSQFAKVPDLANVDLVVTRDRIVDLRAAGSSCLTLVDKTTGTLRLDDQVRSRVGSPAGLPFLALRPTSLSLKMRLTPEPQETTFPINFVAEDDPIHISQGEI